MDKGKALAVVECHGLPVAITFLDTALKSANVSLIGMELARGQGRVDIKISGNVEAVRAATYAGIQSAEKVGNILGVTIIPRPHRSIECMLQQRFIIRSLISNEQKGGERTNENNKRYGRRLNVINSQERFGVSDRNDFDNLQQLSANSLQDDEKLEVKPYTCNLCKDPKCKRIKGKPHIQCMHYDEIYKEGK